MRIEVASTILSVGAVGFGFRVGQFLATEPFDLSQLILSSALSSLPTNPGTESMNAEAITVERPVLESTTMSGAETAVKGTPIFPHNAFQAYGP